MDNLICYKYTSAQNALRCLTDGTLYFSNADELNDCLELRHEHVDSGNFIQAIKNAFSNIEKKHQSTPLSFIDSTDESYEKYKIFYNNENKRFDSDLRKVGIFSATHEPFNQMMWSQYGGEGYGVCFETTWTPSILQQNQIIPCEVRYDNSPRIHNRGLFYAQELERISKKHPEYSSSELMECLSSEASRKRIGINCIASIASVKRQEWAHEKEIRLISPYNKPLKLLPEVLTSIHFFNFYDVLGISEKKVPESRKKDTQTMINLLGKIYDNYPDIDIVNWEFEAAIEHPIPQPLTLKRLVI